MNQPPLLLFAKLPQVMKVPDIGVPLDSICVRGVVCKKNIAHKRMRSSISGARVLLLGGALEYQRVANRLSSFDSLLDQVRP